MYPEQYNVFPKEVPKPPRELALDTAIKKWFVGLGMYANTKFAAVDNMSPEPYSATQQLPEADTDSITELPPLANGFAFVYDESRSLVERIPALRFEGYFHRRLAPVAEPGHNMHRHDKRHMTGYQRLFENKEFADLVVDASENPDEDIEHARQFTRAIDDLGDHTIIQFELGNIHDFSLDIGRRGLWTLIDMASGDTSEADKRALFTRIWLGVGLRDASPDVAAREFQPLPVSPFTPTLFEFSKKYSQSEKQSGQYSIPQSRVPIIHDEKFSSVVANTPPISLRQIHRFNDEKLAVPKHTPIFSRAPDFDKKISTMFSRTALNPVDVLGDDPIQKLGISDAV